VTVLPEPYGDERLFTMPNTSNDPDPSAVEPRRPVFTDEIGVQLTPKAATNAFARLAKKAKIGTTSLHSARHRAATQLIAAGIGVTTTASILGHTNANVTLSLYSHVVEGAERPAMDVLGGRLEQMRDHVVAIEEGSAWQPNGNRGRFGKEKSPCYRAFNGCGDRI